MITLDVFSDTIGQIDSWVQVVALFVWLAGGIALGYINDKAKTTNEKVEALFKNLTTPNSGSHVKDQLDRIERLLDKQDAKIETLQTKVDRTSGTIDANSDSFKYMQQNFKGTEYFEAKEERHRKHEERLSKIESAIDSIADKLRIKRR